MTYHGRLYNKGYGDMAYDQVFQTLVDEFVCEEGVKVKPTFDDDESGDKEERYYRPMRRDQAFISFLDARFKTDPVSRNKKYKRIGLCYVESKYGKYISLEDYDGQETLSIEHPSYKVDQIKKITDDPDISSDDMIVLIRETLAERWPDIYEDSPGSATETPP